MKKSYRINVSTYARVKASSELAALRALEVDKKRIKKSHSIAEDLLLNSDIEGVKEESDE